MSSKFYVLDNHRQLKGDEIIREGDLYKDLSSGKVDKVNHSVGHTPNRQIYIGTYNFYRRLHTKKPKTVSGRSVTVSPLSSDIKVMQVKNVGTKPTPRFPEVKFAYPSTKGWGAPLVRNVKVISLDDTYLVGLEVQTEGGHQFKRYRVDKIRGDIQLLKF